MEMIDYFEHVETEKDYNGYYYSIGEAITILILGSFCELRNVNQIHQWASHEKTRDFLREQFGICKIPCYYWLLCLLKMIKPDSLNQCFVRWVDSLLNSKNGLTLSLDGKTIRSTCTMKQGGNPLHIVSAQIADLGITFGQRSVDSKSNEIPAVQELLSELDVSGCLVVADALNCQNKTVAQIRKGKVDQLPCAKDSQRTLKEAIETYVQDKELRKEMETDMTKEKGHGRIEKRTAYVTKDISWLEERKDWEGLSCIGAIQRSVEGEKGTSEEWHYYISSRELTATELLRHARMEWSIETMHWMLDVHFGEDFCRLQDTDAQKNLNMLRKSVLNHIKLFKERTGTHRAVSKIMFDCLMDCEYILSLL